MGKQDWDTRDMKHSVYNTYIAVRQVHWTAIYELDGELPGFHEQVEADALLSKSTACGVYTADCVPIAFLWREMFVVAHVSWMNLYAWIIQKVVKNLCRQKNDVVDILVYIGPSIRYYEVWEEFLLKFPRFVFKKWGVYVFDMLGYIKHVCGDLGIVLWNIHIHADCTYTQADTRYSWRRNKDVWRNFMWVRPLFSVPS
jgi:copper oxidase (laccase) domain-containing protein